MRIVSRVAWCAAGVLWLVPSGTHAQASPSLALTLAAARDSARRQSPELLAMKHAVAAAAGRNRQANAWPNPTLSYGREQTSLEGESNSQDILSLDQPVELGVQRGARRASARSGYDAAEARLAATAARIDYEVARSYAAAVAARRRAELAAAAAAAFDRAAGVSRARLAAGDVSGYQHRRLALEAARYSALHVEALMARDSALRSLTSMIGLPSDVSSIALTDTLVPQPLAVPADSLVALAMTGRPELRAASMEAEAGAAEARLARAERVPTPILTGGYKHERLAGGISLGGFVAGVTLPLPLWDHRGGAVEAARAEAARREAEVKVVRRQTAREVRTAFEVHQALAEQLRLVYEQLGDDAAKARRAAETAYAEGEIGLLEWLDSVRAYQEAETTYVTVWAEYIARRAALERATGAKLF